LNEIATGADLMADTEETRAARIAGRVLLVALCVSIAPSGAAQAAAAYAFANASPIRVYGRPASSGGRDENFEFGRAYQVDEQAAEYVKLKTGSGATAYVRAADVTLVTSPQWLVTSSGYNKTEREFIRFWNSAARLKDFLTRPDTPRAQWDYQEYFESAPQFQLRLPITQSDSVNLLRGSREVRIISALLPISREMYQAFESERSGFEKKIDLHLIADVSGSTRQFLEDAVGHLAKGLSRQSLHDRVNAVFVTTFGISRHEKSSFRGKVAPNDLAGFVWHRRGVDQTTGGEREPLVDGLVAMKRGVRPDSSGAPVLVVLSGADVELASFAAAGGKPLVIENLEWKLPADTAVIFAQITPEPSDDLRTASRRLRGFSQVYYLEYSETLADDLSSILLRMAEADKSVAAKTIGTIADVAHKKQMMAFLPRVLTSTAKLPRQQASAPQADWYAVRLWLAVHDLIWKVTAQ
jgi:hypothetical protein